jgi:hypothetical protein
MNKQHSPLFRGLLVIALAFAVLAGSVRAAYAANGAFTWQNVTDTFVVIGSCSDLDGVYQITIVSSGAIHYVENEDGYKFSWAENGTYYIEPIDADSPVTYSGRYATQLQDNLSKGNFVFKNTFTNVGLGSDGTRETFHITTHVVVTPTGLVREAENFKWICN